jgi:hypothetical protein
LANVSSIFVFFGHPPSAALLHDLSLERHQVIAVLRYYHTDIKKCNLILRDRINRAEIRAVRAQFAA